MSCSTTKKKSEVKGIKKLYHNTTARFNGYFNANEIMKETMVKLQDMHVDNYNRILGVYDYVDVDNPQAVVADMDKAIEKVSTVATIHDVSNFVDDCYLLIGKAQYMKQDYIAAEETFLYFEDVFDPKNPYGRAYDSKSRRSKSGRKSKKEIKQERKEKEKERKELKKEKEAEKKEKDKEREEKAKAREEERKAKDKERKDRAKEREKLAKERKKRSKSKKSRSSKSRSERSKSKEETTKKAETPKVEEKSAELTEEQKALLEAKAEQDRLAIEEAEKRAELEEEKEKEKEKEEEKYKNQGHGALFKNMSAYTEGLYWLARTYIETERFTAAEYMFKRLEDTPGLKEDILNRIPAAKAHLFLKLKDYETALVHLEEAIELEKDKNLRARYAYIRGQIFERMSSPSRAFEEYAKAKKLSKNYELEFNAGLSELKLSYKEGSTSKSKALKKLDKLLKEAKNDEFADQIYFTRAEVLLSSGDLAGAKADFESAIQSTGGNVNVKTEAYFRLGEVLFEEGLYAEAKTNYDEALKLMKKTDDRYKSVERLSNSLTDIATNIQTVELQDSLLALSELSESELRDIAVNIIEERKANAEEEGEVEENQRKSNIIVSNRQLGSGRSSFFAYNPIALNQGKVDFRRNWGERSLEDNWRRSLRSDASLSSDDIVDIAEEEEETISEDEIRELLRDIPRTEKQITSANLRIQNSLFQLGVLFRERLRNYRKSVEVLERLVREYPDFERKDEALFYLYLSYTDLNKMTEANNMVKLLRREFPESKFTKLATDPNYALELKNNENSIERYYDQTYELFESGEYQSVMTRISEKDQLFNKNKKYAAKFALLNAMSLGSINGKTDYITALESVIRTYPQSPEEARAKEILRFLKGDADAFNDILFEEDLEAFEAEPDKLHYIFIVTYGLDQVTFDKTKVEILNYNNKFHRFDNLKISHIYLNQTNEARIILVRSFENQAKSMEYWNGVQKNKDLFIKDKNIGYDIFPTTQRNYREVIKQRTINNYRRFFELNYSDDKK